MKAPVDGVLEAARQHLIEKIASERAYIEILERRLRGLRVPDTTETKVPERPK